MLFVFTEKDNLRKESLSRFLGFFSFLCQVFGEMRTATGEHFRPLIAPIFNCVDLMLGVSEGKVQGKSRDNADEIECILLQVVFIIFIIRDFPVFHT